MPYYTNADEKYFFIHIPKTGGSSVGTYMSKRYKQKLISGTTNNVFPEGCENRFNSAQHQPLSAIKKHEEHLGINLDECKVFTAVRNPYFRLVSDLFNFKLIDKNTDPTEVQDKLKQYVRVIPYQNPVQQENIKGFRKFAMDSHNMPQNWFLGDSTVDILRTENLTTDMIAYGFIDFNVHVHVSHINQETYLNFLNMESIEIINEFYDKDFKDFKYDKIESESDKKFYVNSAN